MTYVHSNNETDKTIDVSRIANTSSFAARQFRSRERNCVGTTRPGPGAARHSTRARCVCVCVCVCVCCQCCRAVAVAVAAVRVRPTRRRRCRFLANFSRHGSTRPADKRTRRATDRCSHTSRSVLRLYNVYSTHLGVARQPSG